MKIAIPDDYQDVVHRLDCFRLLDGHDVVRYRERLATSANWRPAWRTPMSWSQSASGSHFRAN